MRELLLRIRSLNQQCCATFRSAERVGREDTSFCETYGGGTENLRSIRMKQEETEETRGAILCAVCANAAATTITL